MLFVTGSSGRSFATRATESRAQTSMPKRCRNGGTGTSRAVPDYFFPSPLEIIRGAQMPHSDGT